MGRYDTTSGPCNLPYVGGPCNRPNWMNVLDLLRAYDQEHANEQEAADVKPTYFEFKPEEHPILEIMRKCMEED